MISELFLSGGNMKVGTACAKCLWDRQCERTDDQEYLAEVRSILDGRGEDDSAPYLVFLFNEAYERRYGKPMSYREVKKTFNDLVLAMEDEIRENIVSAPDPLAAAIACARVGNYIDFAAMSRVDSDTLLSLLRNAKLREEEREVLASFRSECHKAEHFLLVADNCGEIVLDRLFLEQLFKECPDLKATVLVRGKEILNDATPEDAAYTCMDELAEIVTNGSSVAGTVYDLLPEEAKRALDRADVILSKGQGNYETLSGQGRHVFYSLLCKCDVFTQRFNVPMLTGIFIEE